MDRYRGPRRSPAPRDRGHRERDSHPDVEYFGEGESYRPGGAGGDNSYRPPNRDRERDRDRFAADSWTADRRDGRREERRDDIDSYVPNTSARATRPRTRSPAFRRRSRTPPNRREDLFANRRSPIRRYSPRRSPPRRRSRSPPGARTRSPPDTKRYREFSPDPARRSPKRERRNSPERNRFDRERSPVRNSPRGGESYRPRSRTPPRRRQHDNWVRRSLSPRDSGPASHNTSRRSSPPVHPDRASLTGSQPRSPPHLTRDQYDSADAASFRGRSPAATSATGGEPRPRETDVSTPRDEVHANGGTRQPPSGPSSYRNGTYERPPPTGPSRSFSQPIQSPPTGPAASMSISAHNRGGGASALNAPTRPRGSVGRFDGPPSRDFSAPPVRGRSGLPFRGPAPYGPRGGSYGRGSDFSSSNRAEYSGGSSYRGGFGRGGSVGGEPTFPFRGNNSSSMTYPRTQRFNSVQQHLATNEKIVPGGKLLPSGLPPDQEKRIKMLEAEAERMRTEIAEKQKLKREVLNEWDVRERESERDSLRSDLAEQHLQQLMEGDDGIGRAAF
ncbi:hypothetical protein Z517_07398 [Fonsecaea pedrosoi CBS 271.37]|uniref:Unplaced genomic scaffold supercont1.4, whole genome shotgun sequence n=1 Tax=Fonsecaea pedrosoi CBS 271.37 TaxID=1442368 RepID=A0A0D2DSD7_9EURO|nr:uncharacterized protein Z517_07398 [Fonsecaea pedrosoi CBS 271.37]KIW80781.1 hypothetical protein Z517_07398 [Fonsecaea pedrosoi CBS 271.37]